MKSALKDDGKVSVNTDNTALRLKVANTNLVALHTQLKSYFEFQDVAKSNYTGNEMRLIEVALCSIDQTLNDGVVSHIAPCGN